MSSRYMAISWLHQQVKDQKEPTHEEMVTYYRDHATEWERPARARWEQSDRQVRQVSLEGSRVSKPGPMGQRSHARRTVCPGRQGPLAEIFRPTKADCNDWTTKGSLRSTVVDAAVFALPVGTLSQIFEDEDGFHIVRVIEREEQRQIPFNEVQNDIKKRLKEQRPPAQHERIPGQVPRAHAGAHGLQGR